MNTKLRKGITEALEVLNHMDESYIKKLPYKFVEFLQNNRDISYKFKYDYSQFSEISREAKSILGIMYLKYWSTKSQQKDFLHILYQNSKSE